MAANSPKWSRHGYRPQNQCPLSAEQFIARSLTDFHYACYLSDLAVDEGYPRRGIGQALQRLTQQQLGPRCSLIVIAAPAADDYDARLGGYERHPRCWVLARERRIGE